MSKPPTIEEWAAQEDLRAELARVNKALSKERSDKLRLEETIRQAAHAAFQSWPAPKAPSRLRERRRNTGEVAVAVCSDWHYGAITPDFNSEVAEQRIRTLAGKIRTLTAIQRADHPVRHLRVWMLGDMVAGENIFPGQAWEIDASVIDQSFGVARVIRDFLGELSGDFESIHVVGLPGNHGRLGTKHNPYHPDSNADRVAYLAAMEATARIPNIGWTIASTEGGESGRILVDRIGQYACLLTHGDLFRGGNSFAGLPYYSFASKALKWRDMSLAGQMPPFTDLACGHWHRTVSVEIGTMTLRVCGTLQTFDPFSRETIAAATRPAQYLAFVHPEAGRMTAEYRLDLS